MQHSIVQQEEQPCVLHDDMQQFLEEISTLRTLAEEAEVAGRHVEELEGFKHRVEHLGASAWERKEVRDLSRYELVRLSLAVLRAFNTRSG
jgi:alkylhydroperoxidase family enzyme